MKAFETPIVEINYIEVADVITASDLTAETPED